MPPDAPPTPGHADADTDAPHSADVLGNVMRAVLPVDFCAARPRIRSVLCCVPVSASCSDLVPNP